VPPAASSTVGPTPAKNAPVAQSTPRLAATPLASPVFADPARPRKVAELVPKLEKRIDAFFAREKPPSLAVAMVVDDRVVMTRVLGVGDVASKAPATSKTLYRIGSITKTFTAAAAVALRDGGALRFDDPAERYLPQLARVEYPFADAPRITLRHLLTHTSGLPRLGDFDYTRPDVDVTDAEMMTALEKTRLASAPGIAYAYSNWGMSLTGLVVAGASPDKTLRGAVARYVTTPLGMTSTTFDPKTLDVPPSQVATGYAKSNDPKPEPLWRLGASEGAGGLWSSLDDMAKYVAFQLAAWPARAGADSGPIARASVRESHSPAVALSLSAEIQDGHTKATAGGVGFAWHTKETCAYERIVEHGGAIDGFHAEVGFAPERGFGFVILSNAVDAETTRLERELFEEVSASGALAPRLVLPAADLVDVVSKYAASFGPCDPSAYDTLPTSAFRQAVPREAWQKICHDLAARHGTCTYAGVEEVRTPHDVDYVFQCTKGGLKGTAVVVEEAGAPRFSGLFVRPVDAPVPKTVSREVRRCTDPAAPAPSAKPKP
jgi:CubicO group peptidase (beta-lactamase class C family)